MNETLTYIDAYFENQLTADERLGFEQRIADDESFAQEVAFYVQARQVLRQTLLQQKQQDWEPATTEKKAAAAPIIKQKFLLGTRRFIAIAASVIVILCASVWILLQKKESPQALAAQYAEKTFSQISATMDGSRDSLQLGIKAYNNKEYSSAEIYFAGVYASHPEQTDALKYSGLVFLALKEYDIAISRFQVLAKFKLYANPGMFYQAIALLQRNATGDKEGAKRLLEQVVDNKQEGSAEAEKWLKAF